MFPGKKWSLSYLFRQIEEARVQNQIYLAKRKLWQVNVKWSPLEPSWVKLNVDGSFVPQLNAMGFGGVVRNSVGEWKLGFAVGLQSGDSFRAELLAVVEGLELCWKEGCKKVICESDCLGVINTAKSWGKGAQPRHKYYDIIKRLTDQCSRAWEVEFVCIPREINCVAHSLTRWGVQHLNSNVSWRSSPNFILFALGVDSMSSKF
uniref:Ribonuclease H protein At1g65750 family n=1 Tax=Cajanus cajan TaxID=3821 RepID=A0A151QY82_CAJCA|nr:Putative ribonuclease H protein At1g65750 family [Cajanus cajan]